MVNGEWLLSLNTTMLSLIAPSFSPLHVEVYGSCSGSSQHAMRPSVEAVQKILLLMLPIVGEFEVPSSLAGRKKKSNLHISIFSDSYRCVFKCDAITWLRRRRSNRVHNIRNTIEWCDDSCGVGG